MAINPESLLIPNGSTPCIHSVERVADRRPTRKSLSASFIVLAVYLPQQLADPWAVAALGIVGVVLLALVGAKGRRG
jgi:hypothetical protein